MRFLDGLIQHHRYAWEQAARALSLLALYEERDFLNALARAVRFRAFSCSAVERILAMQATPRRLRPGERDLRGQLEQLLEGEPIAPRPGEQYDRIAADDDTAECDDGETNQEE